MIFINIMQLRLSAELIILIIKNFRLRTKSMSGPSTGTVVDGLDQLFPKYRNDFTVHRSFDQ